MEKIQIFVLTNRIIPKGYSEIYYPFYLGTGWEHSSGAYYEDSGTNIADKHEMYADLGGFYWIWKNIEADIVGISQYRKYFFSEREKDRFIQSEEILFLLSQYDILVPLAFVNPHETIYEKYQHNTCIEDLEIARDILREKYPEYLEGFDVIMGGCRMHGFNMWIARKKIFDKYCAWIFSILQEAEHRIDWDSHPQNMKRALAFLSEYLFSVWLLHENLKIYELCPRVITAKGLAPDETMIRTFSTTEH
ncbi:MAG: DUF4422 domain-containing protein [Lachnospiraceae bacterium]|nr:DUF4422 domain-containing protein [Lachnospiraceae bacterium]